MLHLRGAEGAKSQFRVSYTMMRLIEQDVVMQRLALESDDDKEQHFFFAILNSTSPGLQIMALVAVASAWSSVSAPPVCLTQQTVAQSSVT